MTNLVNIFLNLSIRRKLLTIFIIVITLNSLFIFIYFPLIYKKQSIEFAIEKSKSIAKTTNYAISPAVYFEDDNALEDILSKIINNYDIVYIIVTNQNDSIIYKANWIFASKNNYKISSKIDEFDNPDKIFKLRDSIFFENSMIGSLYIGLSLEKIQKQIISIQYSIGLISILLLFIGSIIVYMTTYLITKPFSKIESSITAISEGNLSVRVPVFNDDDFGKLSTTFNDMVDKLQKLYSELNSEIDVRRKTEQELIEAQEELKNLLEKEIELNAMKTRFVSMVSHEYRTPLTLIMTTTYIIEKIATSDFPEDFKKHMTRIRNAVGTMINLMEGVLSLGRIESGKYMENLETFDIVNEIMENISTIESNKTNIHFIKSFEREIIEMYQDRNIINHILNNIISNAIKYSKQNGDIIIRVTIKNDFVNILIKDFGIGIPKEDLPNLFKPFFRSKNTGFISGTGLGLSVVKSFVDFIGGEIKVDSELNFGTEFNLLIPLIRKRNFILP